MGLSDDTIRKLSALLWYNGNDNCGSTDYGVKTNDARSSSDHQETAQLKETNNDNKNNNKEDLKHCIVEMYEQKEIIDESNIRKNSDEETSKRTDEEANVEILHLGKSKWNSVSDLAEQIYLQEIRYILFMLNSYLGSMNSPSIRRVSAEKDFHKKSEPGEK